MTGAPSTERVFALSAFEGVRLIRAYSVKQPDTPIVELLAIIEHIESDAPNLDLEASVYLHGLVEAECPLNGDGFYQACISAVVTKHQPNWCKAMKQGRMRFLDSLATNDRDVFAAAGLAKDPPPISVVTWWDTVTGFARLIADIAKMEQAREAEQLSMDYETQRLAKLGLNRTPEWKGLDDNFAGYDVLSYDAGEFGPISRMIEVKSTIASPLRFIITRHEWDQAAKIGPAYIFHVWDMAKVPPVLYERKSEQVAPHIPQDNEKGKWKTAEIPLGV
ncbi:DUF3883 domain-containing protein [Methylocapsa sp. S129]|uniref:DUF3883 domain-containing protein n=1 Tax=Methylocapsa sp. S129 TaxID=1641869 RepID=UPI00131B4B25|nr:DUF3883 domain-containing protein [Methylocapsa sp. S129]